MILEFTSKKTNRQVNLIVNINIIYGKKTKKKQKTNTILILIPYRKKSKTTGGLTAILENRPD